MHRQSVPLGLSLPHPHLFDSREVEAQRGGVIPQNTQHSVARWPWGCLRAGRLQEERTGEASLSRQTPPYPTTHHPALHSGPSASPQEGQEDGPAGWRARLKPVEKKDHTER